MNITQEYTAVKITQFHPFHLVSNSPWPILSSVISSLGYFNGFVSSGYLLFFVLSLLNLVFLWWRDIVREGTCQGTHTSFVQKGLEIGFSIFILSEAKLFFSLVLGISL